MDGNAFFDFQLVKNRDFFGYGLFSLLVICVSIFSRWDCGNLLFLELFCVEKELKYQTSSWSTMPLSATDVSCQCPATPKHQK